MVFKSFAQAKDACVVSSRLQLLHKRYWIYFELLPKIIMLQDDDLGFQIICSLHDSLFIQVIHFIRGILGITQEGDIQIPIITNFAKFGQVKCIPAIEYLDPSRFNDVS